MTTIVNFSSSKNLITIPLIAVITFKSTITFFVNKKTSKFEVFLNDGTGEVVATFWESLRNFNIFFSMFKEGDTISIQNFIITDVLPKYSKGHRFQLKISSNTVIKNTNPILNFQPFEIKHSYTSLNTVLADESGNFIWVKGKIASLGDIMPNQMDDGCRQEVIIENSESYHLRFTAWGNKELSLGQNIALCGRLHIFNHDQQFSCSADDIKVLTLTF